MRRFSPEYLRDTRRGLWDDRESLDPLALSEHDRILDVGAGTGELTHVLREESPATVVAVDADRSLLEHADSSENLVQGDAFTLPFPDDTFDLVVCQALLINLPDPLAAIREFRRVSRDLVAAIEPDNSRVTIESTVAEEPSVSNRARRHYIQGVETDVTLGPRVEELFDEVGLSLVESRRHPLVRTVSTPYTETDVESAKRKALGTRIDEQRHTLRSGGLDEESIDDLQDEWRAMGRAVVSQMAAGEYEREAVVPFFVTVGRVR